MAVNSLLVFHRIWDVHAIFGEVAGLLPTSKFGDPYSCAGNLVALGF